ncbi:MAG TPA: hypothetical protein VHG28_00730 [Longimicrobiaceae bacterium]|nr:hypothetical protein [Longimicrobiaceae bacterium]
MSRLLRIHLEYGPEPGGTGVRGNGTPPRRAGAFFWPADEIDVLRGNLRSISDAYRITRVDPGMPLPLSGPAGRVAYLDPELEPYARAYAASTGGEAVHAASAEERGESPAAAPRVLVADLLSTPRSALESLGALWDDARPNASAGVLHMDGAEVGSMHLLKNLLTSLDLFPFHRGTLVVAPQFARAQLVEAEDETFLLGPLDARLLSERLATPCRHLLVAAHANDPFDAIVGNAAVCSNSCPETAALPPYARDERAIACFAGGGCGRIRRDPEISVRIPVSAIAANHVLWLSCDLLMHRDSVYRSYRALALQLLAGAHTVSLIGSVQLTTGTLRDLLHASFLLDRRRTLGEYHRRTSELAGAFGGIGTGRLLLGDPRLGIGGSPHAPPPPTRARWNGRGITLSPGRVRERVLLLEGEPSAEPLRARVKPAGGMAVGLLGAGADGGWREFELIAFDAAGAPSQVVLDVDDPTRSARRRLIRWRERLGFWNFMLTRFRDQLRGMAGEFTALADECVACMDQLHTFGKVLYRAAVQVERARDSRFVGWDAGPAVTLHGLQQMVKTLQPQLMATTVRFAATEDPNIHLWWLPAFVERREAARARCVCGAVCACSTATFALGRMRRRVLRCPRCGVVGDYETGDRRLWVRLERQEQSPTDAILGEMGTMEQVGDTPVVIGAALRPDPRVDGALDLATCTLAERPGVVQVGWRMDPRRVASTQPVQVYTLSDLAWRESRAWIHVTGI